MQLNASRIKVLQAQDDLVDSMKEVAAKELLHVSHDRHAYKHLLNDLIVQVPTENRPVSDINLLIHNMELMDQHDMQRMTLLSLLVLFVHQNDLYSGNKHSLSFLLCICYKEIELCLICYKGMSSVF